MNDTGNKECESMREMIGLSIEEVQRLDSIAAAIFVENATICDCCQKTYAAALEEPNKKIALSLMYALAMFKAGQERPSIAALIMERIR